MLRMFFLFCFLTIFLNFVPRCLGYPSGAPAFACVGMTPMHWAPMTDPYNMDMEFYQPQTGDDGVTITMTPTSYTPNSNVTITIESSKSDMEGLVLVVNRQTGNTEQPLGSFLECTPSNKVKFLSYYPQATNGNNCVTHSTPMPVSKIQCVFRTPASNEGNLDIAATILKEHDTYWYRKTKALPSTISRAYPNRLTTQDKFADIRECSVNKSCFVYPRLCDQTGNCQYMLSYKTNPLISTVSFEMFANNTGWVAMALSKDEVMDQDFVVGCLETKDKGVATLTTAFTILKDKMHMVGPTPDILAQVTNRKAGIVKDWKGNQQLVCSFDLPFKVSADFPGFEKKPISFDLAKEDVFVFLGDGLTFEGTNMMLMHSQRPLISPKTRMASLIKANTDYFDGMLKRTRIHGTMQIIAWMFCSSIAVILARHYRPNLSKKLGKGPYKLWFLWHLLFIISCMGLAIASLIYILVTTGTWKMLPTVHGALGCVTVGLGLINVLMGAIGAACCAPSNPKRRIFDWCHWIVGLLTRLSAIVTFWLAIRIYGHRDMFDLVGTIVVAIWTGGEIIFFFYFQIRKKVAFWRIKNDFSCAHNNDSFKEEFRTDSYVRHAGFLSFLFYLIFIVGVTIALLFAVWIY